MCSMNRGATPLPPNTPVERAAHARGIQTLARFIKLPRKEECVLPPDHQLLSAQRMRGGVSAALNFFSRLAKAEQKILHPPPPSPPTC